jgi:hypothetical protein
VHQSDSTGADQTMNRSEGNPMRRLTVAGIAALALVLGACGGASDTAKRASEVSTLELVTGAPTAAADAGTAHFEGRVSMNLDGESLTVPFSGDMDFAGTAFSMRMDLSDIPDAPPGAGAIEARLVDGVMYMNLGGLLGAAPGLPAGVEWMRLDLNDFGEFSGQAATENPADVLQGLRDAGTVELVGEESVDGVPTRHYRAQVDTDEALDNVSDELRDSAAEVRDQLPATIPLDVWIDDDGLPRRFRMQFEAAGVSADMEFEFSDFGKDVDLSAPPEDETVDFRELLGGAVGAGAL